MESHPHSPSMVHESEASKPGRLHLSPGTKDFIAGALAGALAISSTQPLDMVRVRLQQPGVKGGVMQTFKTMLKQEGMLSPWKGMALPLAFASLQSAILFQSYGAVVRLTSTEDQQRAADGRVIPTTAQGFLAGSVAGLAQVFLWSPIELVKVRMQLQTVPNTSPQYMQPMAMVRHIMKEEGLRGLFRGFTVTTVRDVPSFGVYFGLYHAFCHLMQPGVHPEEASPLTHVLAGGTAGTISWCSVYPTDVIKTRMQATTYAQTPGKTWIDFGKQALREDGLRAFSKGLQPTLIRAFFMDAASFLGYMSALNMLHKM